MPIQNVWRKWLVMNDELFVDRCVVGNNGAINN